MISVVYSADGSLIFVIGVASSSTCLLSVLELGDFHSQNIMVDVDSDINHPHPKITSVIDWEFSGPDYVSSFAQYPLFIIDHPMWDEDHPMRERNVRDQATFDKLIREAERRNSRHSIAGQQLSRLISGSNAINRPCSFQICMAPFIRFFSHMYLEMMKTTFSTDYYWALMEKGILRKDKERFDMENGVWLRRGRFWVRMELVGT